MKFYTIIIMAIVLCAIRNNTVRFGTEVKTWFVQFDVCQWSTDVFFLIGVSGKTQIVWKGKGKWNSEHTYLSNH